MLTLAKLIDLLQSNSTKSPSFSDMANHISKIANTPVRNVATWAGNVMLAYHHQDFPSDIFLLLAASQAVLTIGRLNKDNILYWPPLLMLLFFLVSLVDLSTSTCSMWDFLSKDMSKSVRKHIIEIHRLKS